MFYLLFILNLALLSQKPVLAISSTPSATVTISESSPTPAASNLDEIQRIRELVQQKVKEKLNSINTGSGKRAYIGKIIQIDPAQITVEYRGVTRTAALDAATTFIDIKRNKTKLESIKIGSDALVMGMVENGNMTAKRIVLIDLKTIEFNHSVTLGKIVDISKSSPIFSLIPIKNKNAEFQIKTDKNTVYLDKLFGKLDGKSLQSGHKIICLLLPDPKSTSTYTAAKIINLDYIPSPTPTKKP